MYNECNIENKIRMNYRNLTQLLISRHLTITTMESATSGQIASLITDTEGTTAVLKGALITYCNEAKNKQGFGVTVTMGNVDPANPSSSVPGQLYFAIDIYGDVEEYYVELPPQPTRLAYKLAVAEEIYEELIKRLD